MPGTWPDPGFERRCLLLAVALVVVGAWFSIGFHHNDEHFQILEFASLKLGNTSAAELPWEYHAAIRSWLQPAIAIVVVKGLGLLGDRDPFHAAFLLRLLSGLLYCAALARLFRLSRRWIHSAEAGRTALLLAAVLWFVPYIAVRFSGEGLSGSLFFLGFASLLLHVEEGPRPAWELWLAGAAMGLAFAARFQTGLLIAPALAWLVWVGRPRPSTVAVILTGLLGAIGASLALDRWGYGEWVFTPWRYLQIQLLHGVAARQFGTAPWWWYVPKIIVAAGPPIGLPLVLGVVTGWVRRPTAGLTWVSLTFFLSHCLLGHKELRFLFPLSLCAPFLIGMALDDYPAVTRWAFHAHWGRVLSGAILALNALGFGLRMSHPARQEIGLLRAIYYARPQRLLIVDGRDPFIIGTLRTSFYRDPALVTANLTDAGGGLIPDMLRQPALVATPMTAPLDTTGISCETLFTGEPEWVLRPAIWSRIQWAEPRPWRLARCVSR